MTLGDIKNPSLVPVWAHVALFGVCRGTSPPMSKLRILHVARCLFCRLIRRIPAFTSLLPLVFCVMEAELYNTSILFSIGVWPVLLDFNCRKASAGWDVIPARRTTSVGVQIMFIALVSGKMFLLVFVEINLTLSWCECDLLDESLCLTTETTALGGLLFWAKSKGYRSFVTFIWFFDGEDAAGELSIYIYAVGVHDVGGGCILEVFTERCIVGIETCFCADRSW